MGTAIVLIILTVIVALIIKSMIKNKLNGKSLSCGGDCKNCRGCH
ncbi:MAG: FeoB-associated Cys-rich membrane protein [Lachnospiraceae bacterium]|nr:FeoB-associated Cys-rich membrane protein [Lachnospiraceae bacterium]